MAKKRPFKHRGKKPQQAQNAPHLPEVSVLTITAINKDGELIAEPVKWDTRRKPPHIVVTESGRSRAAGVGDKVLAKLRRIRPHLFQALVIKVLPSDQPRPVLGVLVATAEGAIIEPVSRKLKESFMVARKDMGDARHGELVAGITLPGMPSLGMTYAKITERLGRLDSPRAASLIASHMHALPSVFSKAALTESEQADAPVLTKDRVDLRDIPLVTIDGEDARDFDDAVFAEQEKDGFHLVVAIADVAFYVAEDSALDQAAFERGNSVYFPDRVIPMLPERLSNGLCSLNPDEDRYCVAVHIWIDSEGNVKRYKFVRGLMKSRYRFTYNDLQAVYDTKSSHPLRESIIEPLYAAYKALASERDRRGALDLNLPEYKIIFDGSGNVSTIAPRVRLEAHRLIEAYMIAANVAAGDMLIKKRAPGIFRVHETPAEERLEELRQMLKLSGYTLQKGGIRAAHFNRVLKASEGKPEQLLIHTAVLRTQMQAYYSPENLGHFGLGLQKYCHFTSPIRRYSDLVTHRALIEAMGGEQTSKHVRTRLPDIALHISEMERKAMMAERDASDRYKVSYMTQHIGNTFPGAINGINEYGLFVTLSDTGVTGFVPVRNLQGDFFMFDKRHACFRGKRTRQVFSIGQPMMIRVQEANAITGSLIFEPERSFTPPGQRPSSHQHRRRR
jgi:ribonuclease R